MTGISPFVYCILIVAEYLIFHSEQIRGSAKQQRYTMECAVLGAMTRLVILIVAAFFFQGFAKSPYDHSFSGILRNGFKVFPWLWFRECMRSRIVNSGNKKYVSAKGTVAAVMFFLCEINWSCFGSMQEKKEIFIYLMQSVLPEMAQQVLLVILVFYGGRKAAFTYAAVYEAFEWYFPVVVSLNWLISMLIGVGVPLFLCAMLLEHMQTGRRSRQSGNIYADSAVIFLCIMCIWFFAGVFPVYPSVVLTGSMEPYIHPGDIILVKKIQTEKEVKTLKEGDILFFTHENVRVSHRIVGVNKETLTFQTKGDNNSLEDMQKVKTQDIKGKVIGRVKKAGLPVMWIKGVDESVKRKMEF